MRACRSSETRTGEHRLSRARDWRCSPSYRSTRPIALPKPPPISWLVSAHTPTLTMISDTFCQMRDTVARRFSTNLLYPTGPKPARRHRQSRTFKCSSWAQALQSLPQIERNDYVRFRLVSALDAFCLVGRVGTSVFAAPRACTELSDGPWVLPPSSVLGGSLTSVSESGWFDTLESLLDPLRPMFFPNPRSNLSSPVGPALYPSHMKNRPQRRRH